jgi:hypothetical protein
MTVHYSNFIAIHTPSYRYFQISKICSLRQKFHHFISLSNLRVLPPVSGTRIIIYMGPSSGNFSLITYCLVVNCILEHRNFAGNFDQHKRRYNFLHRVIHMIIAVAAREESGNTHSMVGIHALEEKKTLVGKKLLVGGKKSRVSGKS